MDTRFATKIEQVSFANGHIAGSPPNQLAVRPRPSSGSAKGTLFVLTEIQGQVSNPELVEKRLAALIKDTYYAAHGGITAGLRRALQTANQWLYQHNATSANEKSLVGGAVIAILDGDDIFAAQIGPTALFTQLNAHTRRYPEQSSWLDTLHNPQVDYSPALGIHPFVEANITHLQVEPGDTLLFCDSMLAKNVATPQLDGVMATSPIGSIGKTLSQQHGQGSLLAVKIGRATRAIDPARPSAASHAPAPRMAAAAPSSGGNNFNHTMSAIGLETEPTDRRNRHSARRTLPRPRPNLPSLPSLPPVEQIIGPMIGAVGMLGKGLRTVLKLSLPGVETEASGPRQAGTQAQPTEPRPSFAGLKYVAIGLPLVILAVTMMTYWYKGYSRENEYAGTMEQAAQTYQQALGAPSNQILLLLDQTETLLAQAEAIKTEQPEITAMRTDIQAVRDQVGRVIRLAYMPLLNLYDTPNTSLKRVIVERSQVYVLDTSLNRVYHHTLDDISDTLLPPPAGEISPDIGNSGIIDMVWMAAGDTRPTSDLFVLSRTGLLKFDPDWGPTDIPIVQTELWQMPVAAGSFYSNFYVLDAQANQIYRYLPTVGGYEQAPETYFAPGTTVDLNGAVDIAIDGSIYVLFQSGQIKQFNSGQPVDFQITGLDIPLKNPTAIYTAPDELAQNIYIADAGNQRIVQLTKDGQFVRQFKPRAEDEGSFDDLRSVYVDEIAQKVFVLNGNQLFAPNLPPQ